MAVIKQLNERDGIVKAIVEVNGVNDASRVKQGL